MARNPVVGRDPGRSEDETFSGTPFNLLLPPAIPKQWIPLPDIEALDILLASGRPKLVIGYMGSRFENDKQIPITFDRTLVKDAGGYYEYEYDGRIHNYKKYHYPDADALVTHSIIGLALYFNNKSQLYYDPQERPYAESLLKGAVPTDPRAHGLLAVRAKPLSNPLRNPLRTKTLRQRKLFSQGGSVVLARVYGDDRGLYAVYTDDSASFYADTPFRKKYGYPAVYDLKFHRSYPPAMSDYLRRSELNIPVPVEQRRWIHRDS